MDLSRYTLGKGFDVSKERSPDLLGRETKNIKHVFVEPDNFYSLREQSNYENLDFIFSENLVNQTKFYRILLKEWFYFCKVGGYIIIKFEENNILDFNKLKKEIEILLEEKIKIVDEFKGFGKENYLVFQKTKNALEKNDSIDKWSFGIITMEGQDKGVDDEIESIKKLNIPEYEILIAGDYNGLYKKDKIIRIIEFDDKKNPGWITKKKNIVCENAKYENIVVTHNKFLFDGNWHKGMKKYGNYFEVLSCVISTPEGERAGDWLTYGTDWSKIARIGLLEYKDWDKNVYVDGGFYILKKSVWKKVGWNEKVFWGQGEDIVLSKDWEENGIITRFNRFAKVTSINWRHGKLREYGFNKKRLGQLKNGKFNLAKYLLKQRIKIHILGKDKLHI